MRADEPDPDSPATGTSRSAIFYDGLASLATSRASRGSMDSHVPFVGKIAYHEIRLCVLVESCCGSRAWSWLAYLCLYNFLYGGMRSLDSFTAAIAMWRAANDDESDNATACPTMPELWTGPPHLWHSMFPYTALDGYRRVANGNTYVEILSFG